MKTAFKIIRFTMVFSLFLHTIVSCNAQNLNEQLINELNNSLPGNVNYSNIEYNKVKVTYPINLNNAFQIVLQNLISEDSNITDLCEGGRYQIKYEVKALTSNFISIQKNKASIFCNYYDYSQYDTINLILGNDGIVYRIKLKESSVSVVSSIINNHQFAEADCNSSSDIAKGYLSFVNKEQQLLIVKNNICIELVNLKINDVLVFEPI